jgi:transposase InsO family protein
MMQANDVASCRSIPHTHGSIAVVERFHRTIKEILHMVAVPEDKSAFERELRQIASWYNEHRPHDTLGGKTPNEV